MVPRPPPQESRQRGPVPPSRRPGSTAAAAATGTITYEAPATARASSATSTTVITVNATAKATMGRSRFLPGADTHRAPSRPHRGGSPACFHCRRRAFASKVGDGRASRRGPSGAHLSAAAWNCPVRTTGESPGGQAMTLATRLRRRNELSDRSSPPAVACGMERSWRRYRSDPRRRSDTAGT